MTRSRRRITLEEDIHKNKPQGECRVLIYTAQKIKKGDVLLYDYNEGDLQKGESELSYDTSYFI